MKRIEKEEEVKYMSPEQVAQALSVKTRLVYYLIKTKELPAFRIGKLLRVSNKSLQNFITTQEDKSS